MSEDLWILVAFASFFALWLPVGALTARFMWIIDLPEISREFATVVLYAGWISLLLLVIIGVMYVVGAVWQGIWDLLHWIAGANK